MPPFSEDTTGSLERARARLYEPGAVSQGPSAPRAVSDQRSLPHTWGENILQSAPSHGKRRVRLAGIFFTVAFLFFLVSLGIAGYFFYYGGNTVSVDKVAIDIQGPSTIAGGDTVPLSLTITNKNAVAIENATIEIDFPDGTRNAADVLNAYPRYIENLGTLASGATVTRSVKVILFGGTGETLTLPISFSYGTATSNATFVKKSSYELAISSTPLSVSVDAPTEIVSGTPFTSTLTVRSNATVSLDNVVLAAAFPFGFSVVSSSLPLSNASFLLGTLSPNATKTITLVGTILGQNSEQKTFHFTVGTAKTAQDQTPAVTYMTQDATVAITAPFITTTLTVNGDTSVNPVINSGGSQSVSVSYTNTLSTSVENAIIAVAVSGSAIDYDSIKTTNGFYRSADHTIVFSRDTDPSLASLAPGASGIGTFTFSTLAPSTLLSSPTITFTTSVSGTRAGQTSITEVTNTSATKTAKVVTSIILSSSSLHNSAPLSTGGSIPPRVNQATTYAIVWDIQNGGNAVAGGTVSALLPSYVSYTGLTSGSGSFSYDSGSRTVSWNVGDLAQNASARGAFQVSFTPSTSQKGSAPALTGTASFSGYDRFAGVQVKASAGSVTTETVGDTGYVSANAIVQ
ncbi:MAG: hypothetical protein NTY93_02905 [Candidatus Kaiserbacteria bacterium]|nr:hypothetical protein [Candidatus Kaiserbacteria bacterium]